MFVSLLFVIFCTCTYAADVEVDLSHYGTVIGTEEESRNKVKFYAFRGIQYAKAPKDEFRFQDPQNPDPWGVRDAKKFANRCPQISPIGPPTVIGDEDCLYVNVYTPTLNPDDELAVMVWIHGGGFVIGSSETYEPHYFMDKRFVFVTFNYRLNALGFMHYDDDLMPGNWGMKDQVALLEWVQEFIHLFGGNKKKVTLAGSSSGAASVNWHMHSPRSKGLFQQAICQSGNARSIWAEIPRHVAQKRAEAIATIAGCVYESIEENVKCLRRISTEELVHIQTRFDIWKGNPYYFGVVIESPNTERPFITDSPWNLKPHTENMPIMIGFTSDEGGFTASGLLANQGEALEELGKNYERLFPVILLYQFNLGLKSEEAVFHVTREIRQHYFDQVEINKSTFPRIKQMLAESQVFYDTVVTLKKYEFRRYFYRYSHRNKHTFAEMETDFLNESGPVHSDDLISLFRLETIFPEPKNLDVVDLEVSKLMINLWTSFVINGDPNFDGNTEPKWNPVEDENKLNFYNIDVESKNEEFDWKKLYSFYEGLGWHAEI